MLVHYGFHYPLLIPVIEKFVPPTIQVIAQGEIVARSLVDYLDRHPEVENLCSKNGSMRFYTTDDAKSFEEKAEVFFDQKIKAEHIRV